MSDLSETQTVLSSGRRWVLYNTTLSSVDILLLSGLVSGFGSKPAGDWRGPRLDCGWSWKPLVGPQLPLGSNPQVKNEKEKSVDCLFFKAISFFHFLLRNKEVKSLSLLLSYHMFTIHMFLSYHMFPFICFCLFPHPGRNNLHQYIQTSPLFKWRRVRRTTLVGNFREMCISHGRCSQSRWAM